MSKWLSVDIDQLNDIQTIRLGGQRHRVLPSPYDLPHSVRSSMSADRKYATFEFDYLDDEPGITVKTTIPWLDLSIGKHSGRVFKLILDASHLGSQDEVLEGVAKACTSTRLKSHRPEGARQRNIDITRAIIADRFGELTESLGA